MTLSPQGWLSGFGDTVHGPDLPTGALGPGARARQVTSPESMAVDLEVLKRTAGHLGSTSPADRGSRLSRRLFDVLGVFYNDINWRS